MEFVLCFGDSVVSFGFANSVPICQATSKDRSGVKIRSSAMLQRGTYPGMLDSIGPRKLSPTELDEKLYGGSDKIPALKDEMTAGSAL